MDGDDVGERTNDEVGSGMQVMESVHGMGVFIFLILEKKRRKYLLPFMDGCRWKWLIFEMELFNLIRCDYFDLTVMRGMAWHGMGLALALVLGASGVRRGLLGFCQELRVTTTEGKNDWDIVIRALKGYKGGSRGRSK